MYSDDRSQGEIIPLTLSDGSVIQAEVTKIGEQPISSETRHFQQATEIIKSVANDISNTLKEIKEDIKPDKFTVSLGLQLVVESGNLTSLIVKGTGNANLQITMEWGK